MAAFSFSKGVSSMIRDRYTKAVLTVLAVGVWVLAIAYAGAPDVLATGAELGMVEESEREPVLEIGSEGKASFATYPLRWYMPLVLHVMKSGTLDCQTTIGVINASSSSINVEIEFIDDVGTVLTTESSGIVAGGLYAVQTSSLSQYPSTGTSTSSGHARIYADNPDVLPVHYIDCSAGDVSMVPFAVGATLEMFRASVPGGVDITELVGAER
jgi:hypothetical protein